MKPDFTVFDQPVIPQCSCPFRLICSSNQQAGIMTLFRDGHYKTPRDCVFFEHRARIHRETTGCEPPDSSEALMEQLAERIGMREADV